VVHQHDFSREETIERATARHITISGPTCEILKEELRDLFGILSFCVAKGSGTRKPEIFRGVKKKDPGSFIVSTNVPYNLRTCTMAEEDQASTGEKTAIRFDVGGKLYKVSRSLIEQQTDTMLARLISETWEREGSGNEAIFIDRDGDQFACVLNYLRYGKVHLPVTISKDALMMDMDYYGIVADGTKISNYDIARLRELNCSIRSLTSETECLVKERDCILAAIACFQKYANTTGTGTPNQTMVQIRFISPEKECVLFTHGFDQDLFTKCLAAQGLKVDSIRIASSNHVKLTISER
jgi:hypothetical protein